MAKQCSEPGEPFVLSVPIYGSSISLSKWNCQTVQFYQFLCCEMKYQCGLNLHFHCLLATHMNFYKMAVQVFCQILNWVGNLFIIDFSRPLYIPLDYVLTCA